MTITLKYSCEDLVHPASAVGVNLPRFNPDALLKIQPTEIKKMSAGSSETTYVVMAGDPDYPTTIRIGNYPAQKKGTSSNRSIKVSTWRVATNSETGEVTYSPEEFVVSNSSKGGFAIASAEGFLTALMITLATLIHGGTSYVPHTDVVEELTFGSTELLG